MILGIMVHRSRVSSMIYPDCKDLALSFIKTQLSRMGVTPDFFDKIVVIYILVVLNLSWSQVVQKWKSNNWSLSTLEVLEVLGFLKVHLNL